MMKVLFLLLAGVMSVSAQTASGNFLVTKDAAGAVKIGMTIGEATEAMPKDWRLGPGPGSEGLVSIGVFEGETLLMEIGFYEDSSDGGELPPINLRQKIERIGIFDPRFRTADGIHVGSKLADVEKSLGKLKEMFNYPHIGEFGTFAGQPRWLSFTFKSANEEEEAGIYEDVPDCAEDAYPPSCRKATKYTSGAVVNTMAVVIPEPGQMTISVKGLPKQFKVEIYGPKECVDEEGVTEYGVWTTIGDTTYPQFFEFEGVLPCLEADEGRVEREEEYEEQFNVFFGDYNFDGKTDLALRDGMSGGYGAATYQIYLFESGTNKFVNSKELTELAQYQGMFEEKPDEKMIYVSSKSGCCFHQVEGYKVANDKPVKVYEKTIDATGLENENDEPKVTIKRLVDGKWKVVDN